MYHSSQYKCLIWVFICFVSVNFDVNKILVFIFPSKKKSITKYLYRLARKVNRFYATLITWNFFLKLMISWRVSKAFIYVSQSAHTHSQNMLMMLHILGLVRLLFLSLLVSISQIFVFFFCFFFICSSIFSLVVVVVIAFDFFSHFQWFDIDSNDRVLWIERFVSDEYIEMCVQLHAVYLVVDHI